LTVVHHQSLIRRVGEVGLSRTVIPPAAHPFVSDT
jgi:hypothetical protein